uniref:Uncharacterized protein n=1 Tax=Solanum lycopersicum TaxID=4081 RepID=A0A494G8Q1_SOLLC
MKGRRRAWHAITALGQHTWSDDVGRGMPSLPLDSTSGRTTSGVACRHGPSTPHTEERHRAWHDIITFGQHTRLNYVGRAKPSSPLGSTNAHTVELCVAWHDIIALELQAWSDDIGRGMISYPLEGKHGRTTSGVTCHHRLWAPQTIE